MRKFLRQCFIVVWMNLQLACLGSTLSTFDHTQTYSWNFEELFFIEPTSLPDSAVWNRLQARSLIECCTLCKYASGVVYRDGECAILDVAQAAPSFVVTDESYPGAYKVMNNTNFEEKEYPECKSAFDLGNTEDGVYNINPNGTSAFPAFCDMENGGWTVIQRRVDDSVDFYRGWDDYVAGFGNVTGNYWAGLEQIHALTSGQSTELYVSMESWENETRWASYSSFTVGDMASGYLMTISGYTGTAGDDLAQNNNKMFTTYDKDQDASANNCAVIRKGAWWYGSCAKANVNGPYLQGASGTFESMHWIQFKGVYYSLKYIALKIRNN